MTSKQLASSSRSGSAFLKVLCPRCRKHHIIFGKSTSYVKCSSCRYLLSKPGGGKAKIRAPIKEVYHGS